MADFNYGNMENELLNTVLEEEDMPDISEKETRYRREAVHFDGGYDEEAYDGEDGGEPGRQWGKLAVSLFASAAVFAGLLVFLHSFSTEYAYDKTEAAYQDCLTSMAQDDHQEALGYADELLQGDDGNLQYLALKNTICEALGDSETQMEVLQKIITADVDNYPAYGQLLQLYLAQDDHASIKKLADNAPNSVIASMLRAYLVEAPYLELTPGVYDTSQMLSISSDGDHNIYYTLDGSSPQENGTMYMGPVPLNEGHYTVKAVCRNENGVYGDEVSGEYQIGINTDMDSNVSTGTDPSSAVINEPSVYPESGVYTSPQMVTIDVPIGYRAYYSWTLGTALTAENGTLYSGALTMPEGDSVLSVLLSDGNGTYSTVKQVSYSYQP